MNEAPLSTLLQMRKFIQSLAGSIDSEQALVIPQGFSNNIAWNIHHITVTQQMLCYKLSGLEMKISEQEVAEFGKGSSPKDWSGTPDMAAHYEKLTVLAEIFAEDYRSGLFKQFMPYKTSAGIELQNIEQAISFNNMHEGLHLGYILAMKHCL